MKTRISITLALWITLFKSRIQISLCSDWSCRKLMQRGVLIGNDISSLQIKHILSEPAGFRIQINANVFSCCVISREGTCGCAAVQQGRLTRPEKKQNTGAISGARAESEVCECLGVIPESSFSHRQTTPDVKVRFQSEWAAVGQQRRWGGWGGTELLLTQSVSEKSTSYVQLLNCLTFTVFN